MLISLGQFLRNGCLSYPQRHGMINKKGKIMIKWAPVDDCIVRGKIMISGLISSILIWGGVFGVIGFLLVKWWLND